MDINEDNEDCRDSGTDSDQDLKMANSSGFFLIKQTYIQVDWMF